MRKVITVHGGRFDLDGVRPRMESIVGLFDRYMDNCPGKTATSKYKVMKPIAKILERAATRDWDAQALTGYALRIREMDPQAQGYLNPTARQALEEGTAQLVVLCREVPVTVVAKVVERIDYSLYYARRKKGIERLENTRQMFVRFLQDKYGNDFGRLTAAWGVKDAKGIESFAGVYYPSDKSEVYKNSGAAKKSDVDAFWQQYADQATREEEEDND